LQRIAIGFAKDFSARYCAAMRKSEVIAFYGHPTKVAEALDISRQAVLAWPDRVPEGSAYKLQVITAGRLRVDPADYAPKQKRAG
jgi:hypothetical protein